MYVYVLASLCYDHLIKAYFPILNGKKWNITENTIQIVTVVDLSGPQLELRSLQ